MKFECETKERNITTIKLEEIHPSWIETLPNGLLIKKLILKSSSNSQLIEYTMQQLKNIESIDLQDNLRTTRLIHESNTYALKKIILMAGAAQFSKQLSRTISQQEVRIIKDSLGEDVYRFSLYEAPLTFPKLLEIKKLNNTQVNTDKIFISIINAGYRSLKIALERIPNNCSYKLPKQWEEIYLSERNKIQIDKEERLLHMDLIFFLFKRNHCSSS